MEEVRCEVCGSPTTRYAVVPICDNPVCYQVRLEHIEEMIEVLNNKLAATTAEGNVDVEDY